MDIRRWACKEAAGSRKASSPGREGGKSQCDSSRGDCGLCLHRKHNRKDTRVEGSVACRWRGRQWAETPEAGQRGRGHKEMGGEESEGM